MSTQSFLIVIDTPSVKRYVFGTDPLNEVRGASARLDWLNREEMQRVLREHVGTASVEKIYANGGSAQFLVHQCRERTVEAACRDVVRHLREQTGGEVRAVYGIAPLPDTASYPSAVGKAHFRLRCRRDFASGHHSTSTMPGIMECESASHQPAAHRVSRGAEGPQMLSVASWQKAQEGQQARARGLWEWWMRHLQNTGPWPPREGWQELRCPVITDLGERSSWRNYIGIVYADGNAMGRMVQDLDTPETCRQFSTIVDSGIREACFSALGHVIEAEIERVRQAIDTEGPLPPLPADILLLGGDDLLVAVPADRALDFALHVADEFERLTREKVISVEDADVRRFFEDRLGDRGFTVSCGVAIAKGTYPFYLSLDLAEALLKNAKRDDRVVARAGTHDSARIDFHVIAGPNSHALDQVRRRTFRVTTDAIRTLRPLNRSQLRALRDSVQELRQVGFASSKLHQLQDASLSENATVAERVIRDIFARCRHSGERSERRALWNAVKRLCPEDHDFDFPWFRSDTNRILCVADIVEAYRLFGEPERRSS